MLAAYILIASGLYFISTIMLFSSNDSALMKGKPPYRYNWETITINIVSGGMLTCLIVLRSL